MRVIQTKNDTIRLIFNPKADGLRLSDFLIVRDGEHNFLGQIVEIYDDKFNQEENVASIRLAYRILPDSQVVPYDNFTPSRECEIAKIKLEEIEKCVNDGKTPVPYGISTKNDQIVSLNIDFFNNNPVIFADKLNEVNAAFQNAAQKLKSFKKVVVIDYTGNLNIKNAKRLCANSDFKLPLDYYSLDYIWQKALKEVSIEAQMELDDMFEELKKFVNSTEDKYIPFPRFLKVIEQQYKMTPAPELRFLLNKLRSYWNQELFARSKKEFQGITKALQKESVVILDLSALKLEWHREFLDFIVREIKEYDVYFLLRLNDNNSNPEIINNLYINNPNLNIIPSISYGFAKMPCIMEFARNYILYKTLNPRRDFGFANSQVVSLNSASFLAFGEDTMDFMFTLKNYIYDEEDLGKKEDKKIYIDLNLELEEMTSVELEDGNFELKNVHIQTAPSKSRLEDEIEISDVVDKGEFEDIPLVKEEEVSENITEAMEPEETLIDEETNAAVTGEEAEEETEEDIPIAEDELDYFVNEEETKEDVITAEMLEDAAASEELKEEFTEALEEEQAPDADMEKKTEEEPSLEAQLETSSEAQQEPTSELATETKTTETEPEQVEEEVAVEEPAEQTEIEQEPEVQPEAPKEPIIIVKEKPNLQIDDFSEPEPEDSISLKELAKKSIETRFDEVMEETGVEALKKKAEDNKLKISDSVSIDLESLKDKAAAPETILPVFNHSDDVSETGADNLETYDFNEGMRVSHEKYGTGVILKVVKYSNRCLLQIEFEETGKRLLDPKIANVKPVG